MLKESKKIESIDEIDNAELKKQLKNELKNENAINSFLKLMNIDLKTINDHYELYSNIIRYDDTINSDEYKFYNLLIEKQKEIKECDIIRLKKMVLNDETSKLRILCAKGNNLLSQCNYIDMITSIEHLIGDVDYYDSIEPNSFILEIEDVLKETYLYITELLSFLHFLGIENDMEDMYYINFSYALPAMGNYKRSIILEDDKIINLIGHNLSNLRQILDKISSIYGNYGNFVDYACGQVDTYTYEKGMRLIENFKDMVRIILEKLISYVNKYYSNCVTFKDLCEKISFFKI